MDQLIPGLPDEIAQECLIRVPHDTFPTSRAVCRRWRQEFESQFFHTLRRKRGMTRTIVALAQAEPSSASRDDEKKSVANTPSYRLALFDPAGDSWSCLPPVPGLPCGLPLFCQLAAVGRELVVVGGWDPDTWGASDAVHVYDFVSGSWRHGSSMPGPRRSFFACAGSPRADRREVLVAGGHDEEKRALRSALAYDVARDVWAPLPDMARERDECRGVLIEGRFHVVGGYATSAQGRYTRSSEAYDVALGTWGPVEEETLDVGSSPRTCVVGGDGRLYMCRPGGTVVAAGEVGGGEWRKVGEVPEDATVAPQLVGWDRRVMLMGSEMHGGPQSVYMGELEGEGKGLKWRRVVVPDEFCGLVHASCCFQI